MLYTHHVTIIPTVNYFMIDVQYFASVSNVVIKLLTPLK